jgi:hypothetical protein
VKAFDPISPSLVRVQAQALAREIIDEIQSVDFLQKPSRSLRTAARQWAPMARELALTSSLLFSIEAQTSASLQQARPESGPPVCLRFLVSGARCDG